MGKKMLRKNFSDDDDGEVDQKSDAFTSQILFTFII